MDEVGKFLGQPVLQKPRQRNRHRKVLRVARGFDDLMRYRGPERHQPACAHLRLDSAIQVGYRSVFDQVEFDVSVVGDVFR